MTDILRPESKKTSIQIENDTLTLLNECKSIEARRRGIRFMKHDSFLRFVLHLYKKAQSREDGKSLLYLAMKEEIEYGNLSKTEK